ncbi:enoyl-CoA hydratase-related protein [Halomonas sp. V046]|uniref:enoyl-CoA hydratase-related protein n=1 Tax=Halomonas sp. V046 TaxID=3459611 RepID=UPI004044EBF6
MNQSPLRDGSFSMIEAWVESGVGVIRLHRPDAHNALCDQLLVELGLALDAFERRAWTVHDAPGRGEPAGGEAEGDLVGHGEDGAVAGQSIGAVIITGGGKVFAAGADIGEMAGRDHASLYADDYPFERSRGFERLERCRLPVIAAVSGLALGGGCELAMACDILLASDSARFGQPEIKLGTMPGAGGTQRLVRAIGKAKAMELCLTGRTMDALEAERAGLVARVVPNGELMAEAMKVAGVIARHSRPAVMRIRESIDQAFETGLAAGLVHERRAFQATFDFADRREGMAAFAEKRAAVFVHR